MSCGNSKGKRQPLGSEWQRRSRSAVTDWCLYLFKETHTIWLGILVFAFALDPEHNKIPRWEIQRKIDNYI